MVLIPSKPQAAGLSMVAGSLLLFCPSFFFFFVKASEYRLIDLWVIVLVREWVFDQMDGEDCCSVRIQDVSLSLQMLTCDHHRHRNSYRFSLLYAGLPSAAALVNPYTILLVLVLEIYYFGNISLVQLNPKLQISYSSPSLQRNLDNNIYIINNLNN